MEQEHYQSVLTKVRSAIEDLPELKREVVQVARDLARTELYDKTVYEMMAEYESGDTRTMLQQLMAFEDRHMNFWKSLGNLHDIKLSLPQRIKLIILNLFRRFSTSAFTLMVLEAMEHYGVAHYIDLWKKYRATPLGIAIREILVEELKHEDELVESSSRNRVRGEDVRNMILGLNDGLVEVLGSIGGFVAALQAPRLVALAASIVGVAGSISMAAGTYISVKSENEVHDFENAKREVLEELTGEPQDYATVENPWRSATFVGIFYILGALIPVTPFWLGASGLKLSLVTSLIAIGFISLFLSLVSGMPFYKKLIENAIVAMGAAGVTYLVGHFAQALLGTNI